MKLSEKISNLRKEKGYSQEHLAEICGVTRQTVSKWETGTMVPEINKILLLSNLFAVSLDVLLKDDLVINAAKSSSCGSKSSESKIDGIFAGTIIKESLSDETILDYVSVNKVELWKTKSIPNYWTALYFTSLNPQFPELLSKAILDDEDKGGNWYVDMKSGNIKYIIFKNLILKYEIGDNKAKEAVCTKCRELGIPENQLDWPE